MTTQEKLQLKISVGASYDIVSGKLIQLSMCFQLQLVHSRKQLVAQFGMVSGLYLQSPDHPLARAPEEAFGNDLKR